MRRTRRNPRGYGAESEGNRMAAVIPAAPRSHASGASGIGHIGQRGRSGVMHVRRRGARRRTRQNARRTTRQTTARVTTMGATGRDGQQARVDPCRHAAARVDRE
ncbi:hypothetical protein Asera_19260 [Actinocatenispora sera]|uniref:Uncharacterized protein n=1 Tax=Actinocatenispora sera TaxID=390989 RepID=A0A810L0R3_9ACTN|nr:hypothetical protein Asera_19260 [Actinocatenispora sera]